MYNLEVEQEHQFYVGEAGVLVHNAYEIPGSRFNRRATQDDLLEQQGMQEVLPPSGRGTQNPAVQEAPWPLRRLANWVEEVNAPQTEAELAAIGESRLSFRRGPLVRPNRTSFGAGEHASSPRASKETQERFLTPFLLRRFPIRPSEYQNSRRWIRRCMDSITFVIDGEEAPIETIWVHFQGGDSPDARPFALTVPSAFVNSLFDPKGYRPPATNLDAYVAEFISEVGTAIVDGILNDICDLLHKERAGYQWVIATVDDVKDTGPAMVLRGKVVPFIPGAPVFKKLE